MICYLRLIGTLSSTTTLGIQGPIFTIEPPNTLEFTNTMGARADCVAKANPSPIIEWYHMDNSLVIPIPKVYAVLINMMYLNYS